MQKFPKKYIERMKQILPKDELDLFFEKVTEPLPKVIRCKDSESIKNIAGWKLSPTAISEGFFIDRDDRDSLALGKTLPHFTGQIYVQSLSSMLPVDVLNPQPDEKILTPANPDIATLLTVVSLIKALRFIYFIFLFC